MPLTDGERAIWEESERRAAARDKALVEAIKSRDKPTAFKKWWPVVAAVLVAGSTLFGIFSYVFVTDKQATRAEQAQNKAWEEKLRDVVDTQGVVDASQNDRLGKLIDLAGGAINKNDVQDERLRQLEMRMRRPRHPVVDDGND
jgi:hypothetical protein